MKIMEKNPEKTKEIVKEYSKKLTELGTGLSKNPFSYKIEEKSSKEYWGKRIKDFEDHSKKSLQYYQQVHGIINAINKEDAEMFLLRIGKFRQMSVKMIGLMEKIRENPSIINSKDKQQSIWSKEIRQQIIDQSNNCLNHEKQANEYFRDFYEKNIKEIVQNQ